MQYRKKRKWNALSGLFLGAEHGGAADLPSGLKGVRGGDECRGRAAQALKSCRSRICKARRRIGKFCDGFSSAWDGSNNGNYRKICAYMSKMDAPNQTQACCLRLCGKLFSFLEATKSFHGHAGLEPALFPLHPQLFQVKGQCQQEQLRADVALARVRNRRNPKSFLSRPKAPSTWMERQRRR